MGVGRIFAEGATVIFPGGVLKNFPRGPTTVKFHFTNSKLTENFSRWCSKEFSKGPNNGEISFYQLKTNRKCFFFAKKSV